MTTETNNTNANDFKFTPETFPGSLAQARLANKAENTGLTAYYVVDEALQSHAEGSAEFVLLKRVLDRININREDVTDQRTPEQIRIDELKAELARAEKVVREQAREVKRQEEEAKRKVETTKRIAANQPKAHVLCQMAAALLIELKANGITGVTVQPSFVDEYGNVKMPSFEGIDYTVKPYFEVRYSNTSWRASANGYKVTVGESGNKKTFLQLKDGSFNYAKIAEEVALRINASKVADKREEEARQRRATARAAADRLVKVLGGTVREGGYDSRGRYEYRTASISMSVETAQLLADRIAELEARVDAPSTEAMQNN